MQSNQILHICNRKIIPSYGCIFLNLTERNDSMNLLIEVPKITKVQDLEELLRPIYIIEDFMDDYDTYEEFQIKLMNIICGCFAADEKIRRKCIEHPVQFKFYREDNKAYTIQLRHFLYNVYLWYSFVEVKDIRILDETFILDAKDIPHINDFINEKVIKVMRELNVKETMIGYNVSKTNYKLRGISLELSQIMGFHFDEKTFIEMFKDPVIHELMTITLPHDAQPVEIEKIIDDAEKKLVNHLKTIPNNPISVILRAGTGIKIKQLVEYLIMMGMKPSLEGEVMPIPIETSSLIGGLNRPSYQYIDASGARKPLIMNYKEMGNAGYFSKKMLELARTLELSKEVSDCNTKHLVTYEIKSRKHLKKLVGKYYKLDGDDDFRLLKPTDENMIGKKIQVRSAVTCACGQNHVCARCVGEVANLNWDIAEGIAGFESEENTKEVEQNILSSKHLLTTKSEKIEFSDTFKKYFTLSSGEISTVLEGLEDVNDLALYISPDEIERKEEFDSDSTYNTFINSGRFFIINLSTGEQEEIKIKNNKEIYITGYTMNQMKSSKDGFIRFRDLDDSTPILEVTIMNNELTKPLYDLMKLLDTQDRSALLDEVTIDTFSQKYLDTIIEANMSASMAAGELVINRIVRERENIRRRPDFSSIWMPDYKIYTISSALEHNASVTIGLSFEQLQRQLLNPNLDERTGTSYMDVFFQETLSTKEFKKYAKDVDNDDNLKESSFYLNKR